MSGQICRYQSVDNALAERGGGGGLNGVVLAVFRIYVFLCEALPYLVSGSHVVMDLICDGEGGGDDAFHVVGRVVHSGRIMMLMMVMTVVLVGLLYKMPEPLRLPHQSLTPR